MCIADEQLLPQVVGAGGIPALVGSLRKGDRMALMCAGAGIHALLACGDRTRVEAAAASGAARGIEHMLRIADKGINDAAAVLLEDLEGSLSRDERARLAVLTRLVALREA